MNTNDLIAILKEAAEILEGRREIRFPIIDELAGFASMLEDEAKPKEPDWSNSGTSGNELWKDPAIAIHERLQVADAEIHAKAGQIANFKLREENSNRKIGHQARMIDALTSAVTAVPQGYIAMPLEANTDILAAMQRQTSQSPINMSRVYAAAVAAVPDKPKFAGQVPIGFITIGDVEHTSEGAEIEGWDVNWEHSVIDALPEFAEPNAIYPVYIGTAVKEDVLQVAASPGYRW